MFDEKLLFLILCFIIFYKYISIEKSRTLYEY